MRGPDIAGEYGRAWRSSCPAPCVASYLISRPSSRTWTWWEARLVDLRQVQRPALQYPMARYELRVAALDARRRSPDPDDGPFLYLVPADLTYQFHGVDEARARDLVEYYVDNVVLRGASPDVDYAPWWMIVLGGALAELRARGAIVTF